MWASGNQQPDATPSPVPVDPAKIADRLFDTRLAPEPNKLNTHQRNAFAETVRVYTLGEGIHSAHVLGNASALNTSVYPTGQVGPWLGCACSA